MKISPFSGQKKDWERWSITFLAKSRLRGYKDVLLGIEIVPSKGGKDFDAFLLKNDVAYAELLISCEDNLCFELVNSSRSEQLPEGDAHLAWSNLMSKFEPKTKANLIQMKKEFVQNVLPSVSHDPDVWIQSLENMKRRLQILGHQMSEMDLIIHILQNLPKEYETTLELLENDLENDVATLDRVKEKLRTKFERLQRGKSMSDNALLAGEKVKNGQGKTTQAPKTQDGALINGGKGQTYKGLCTYCGVYGHRANSCLKRLNKGASNVNKNKSSGDPSYFPGICFKCNKKGNKSFDCPFKVPEEFKIMNN